MVRTGDWLREAWSVVTADIGMYILVGLIVGATNGIPYVGTALLCGAYLAIFASIQSRSRLELSPLGRAFQADIGLPAFLVALIQGGIVFVIYMAMFVIGLITGGLGLIVMIPGLLIVALGMSVIWLFAFPLVADRQLPCWQAMETSRKATTAELGGFIGFVLIAGLIVMVGSTCTFGLGSLILIPWMMVATAIAYRDTLGIQSVAGAPPAYAPPGGPETLPPPPMPPTQ